MTEPLKTEDPGKARSMVTEEKALEKYSYRPMEKVGSVGTLKALLQAQEKSLAAVLPKHLTPDRLFRTLLTAINRTPGLLECTQASIVESVSRAAELGLDVSGTLQEAWILPFNNNVGTKDKPLWVKQATFLPGYRGLARLARNSGEIARLESRVVKEKDFFELEYGSQQRLVFRPYLKGDRGKTTSCYSLVKLTSGEEIVDWMTAEEVEKIRQMSKQPNSLMWRDHWDEGARKTVFRRLSKWLPLSPDKSQKLLQALVEADQEFDLDRFAEAVTVNPESFKVDDIVPPAATTPTSASVAQMTPDAAEDWGRAACQNGEPSSACPFEDEALRGPWLAGFNTELEAQLREQEEKRGSLFDEPKGKSKKG